MTLSVFFRDSFFEVQLVDVPKNLVVGRVARIHGKEFEVRIEDRQVLAYMGDQAWERYGPLAVGDWVLLDNEGLGSGKCRAVSRLERKSYLSRRAVGDASATQLIAANVDWVWIVTSANQELNLARLERYLSLAEAGNCEPVIVVNKCDLAEDSTAVVDRLRLRFPWVQIFGVSALEEVGLDALRTYLQPGKTVALLGSSGVGKTTLRNRIAPDQQGAIQEVRQQDAKGRHTTTVRELIDLPCGARLIDTPGMRELGLLDAAAGISSHFEDVESIASNCKFRDCEHQDEPGCAVQKAIATGQLVAERLKNYQKLQREEAFHARRRDAHEALNTKRRWKNASKAMRRAKADG